MKHDKQPAAHNHFLGNCRAPLAFSKNQRRRPQAKPLACVIVPAWAFCSSSLRRVNMPNMGPYEDVAFNFILKYHAVIVALLLRDGKTSAAGTRSAYEFPVLTPDDWIEYGGCVLGMCRNLWQSSNAVTRR